MGTGQMPHGLKRPLLSLLLPLLLILVMQCTLVTANVLSASPNELVDRIFQSNHFLTWKRVMDGQKVEKLVIRIYTKTADLTTQERNYCKKGQFTCKDEVLITAKDFSTIDERKKAEKFAGNTHYGAGAFGNGPCNILFSL
jgi:hypothetical protein